MKTYVFILISIFIVLLVSGCILFPEKKEVENDTIIIKDRGITTPPIFLPNENTTDNSIKPISKIESHQNREESKDLHSISVTVFDDVNVDGISNDNYYKHNIADWAISINGTGTQHLEISTKPGGLCSFNNLPEGNYLVCVTGKKCCDEDCWAFTSNACQNIDLKNGDGKIEFGVHMLPQNARIDKSALNAVLTGHATTSYPSSNLRYKFWRDGNPISEWSSSPTTRLAVLGQQRIKMCVIDNALIDLHGVPLKESCNCISTLVD